MGTQTEPKPLYRDATWLAINGHVLEGEQVSYDNGKTWRSINTWRAGHSVTCHCTEADGDDW